MERIVNDTWTSDCLFYLAQFQAILAKSTDRKLNLYTCEFSYSDVIGNAAFPWLHEEDSVYNGVTIHPGTLPGGTLKPVNEGDNLVHEVCRYIILITINAHIAISNTQKLSNLTSHPNSLHPKSFVFLQIYKQWRSNVRLQGSIFTRKYIQGSLYRVVYTGIIFWDMFNFLYHFL